MSERIAVGSHWCELHRHVVYLNIFLNLVISSVVEIHNLEMKIDALTSSQIYCTTVINSALNTITQSDQERHYSFSVLHYNFQLFKYWYGLISLLLKASVPDKSTH